MSECANELARIAHKVNENMKLVEGRGRKEKKKDSSWSTMEIRYTMPDELKPKEKYNIYDTHMHSRIYKKLYKEKNSGCTISNFPVTTPYDKEK